ncbi:ABC transporter ATP-binding protein [Spiroplasma endosymbiont of Nebria brevicollis]|uniref:ABC transporter ATP-binding protein n=1 Tax=Spiroplasma endosymbiont of Nebria brevicollis TaxID=3066284 RepID=UPI00313CC040
MSDVMISVKNYNINFKRFKIPKADFIVYKGTIHALVGQSGSGKSVLLKSIIGAFPSTCYQGEITVNGHIAGSAKSKLGMGYALNLENFPQGLSAYNFLKYLGKTTGINSEDLVVNLEKLLKSFNLWEHRHKKLNSYSSGMKNRIMLIQALVHDPQLIILDEPGANLDSESRKYFTNVLKQLKAEGKTIFLTTHMINEVKDIVDNCTIIDLGNLIYSGPVTKFDVGKIFILNTNNNNATIELLKNTIIHLSI